MASKFSTAKTHAVLVRIKAKFCYRNGGEYPRAFVVRKKGVVAERELLEMIKSHFAPHKWLTGGVYFVDSIPRTGSGKVIRRELPVIEQTSKALRGRL